MTRIFTTLLIWLALAVPAFAQFPPFAQGTGLPNVYVGPGDIQPTGWLAWYGFRAFNAAYATGSNPAINVTRASDSTSEDIMILASGDIDVSELNTFCSLGVTDTCTIGIWYDQSGNGNNWTSSGSSEPELVFSCAGLGSTMPCLSGAGGGGDFPVEMVSTNNITQAQPYTFVGVGQRNGTYTGGQVIAGPFQVRFKTFMGWAPAPDTAAIGDPSVIVTVGNIRDNAWAAMVGIFLGDTVGATLWANDGVTAPALLGGSDDMAGYPLILFGALGGSVLMTEFGVNGGDLTSVEPDIMANMRTYWRF